MKFKLPFHIGTNELFYVLLDDFTKDLDDINKPQYTTRIPYTTWRELKKPFSLLTIDANKNPCDCINLKFTHIDALAQEFTFNIYDNGFGTWLHDHFYLPGEENKNNDVEKDDDSMMTYEYTPAQSVTAGDTLTWNNVTYPCYDATIGYSNNVTTNIPTMEDIKNVIDEKLNEKETKKMNKTNDFMNFDFGPADSKQFAASPYGIAVYAPETDTWLTYNSDTNEVVDAKIFHFDVKGFFYKIPTPISNIKTGDIIIHMGTPMFVRTVNNDNTVTAVNYHDASVTTILPKKSPFGFNFITKVVSLMNFDKMSADKDNPFGNMLPFLMMQDGKFDPMMLLFMNGGNIENMNPLMFYLMMDKKDNNDRDMLPLMLMMSGGTFNF